MRLSRLALVAALVVCRLGAPADADDYVVPEFLAAPPALPPNGDAPVWRLDLAEARKIAIKQNLGISLERKQLAVRRLGVAAATWGMYEPSLTAGYDHGSSGQPPGTLQAGDPGSIITSTSDTLQLGLVQHLPTGGQLSLSFRNDRNSSTAGTAVEPLTFNSSLSVTASQPLFRGFSLDLAIPQYSILTARIASQRERHELEIMAATTIEQTEAAYWDVVSAVYSYNLAIKSQTLAENTVALVQRQIAAGMAPTSDSTGAESTLAQRKLAVLSAEAAVDQASDALRTILNLPRDQWTRPILPTDLPRVEPAETTSPDDALATAIKRRPELAEAALDLASSDLALRKAANDRLPQIDLGITASTFGQDMRDAGALRELGARDATGWSVMLNLTWTPLGRTTGINAEIARIQHTMTTTAREQRVQVIWNEVRTAFRNQRAASLQVTAASRARILANDSLEIENRKYIAGTSSSINLATLQKGLADAELAELQALLAHDKAATALLRATGQLLEQRHIELAVTP